MEDLILTRNVCFMERSRALRKLSMASLEHPFKIIAGTELDTVHDEIIRRLEAKVKDLTREVEGRPTETKIGEFKAIFTKDRLIVYTPFYYSLEEIEYFSVNSSFSEDETQEEIEEVKEIEEIVAH
ncbi:hypothetical protein Tco_0254523, partial [Tanacetum coccineum]